MLQISEGAKPPKSGEAKTGEAAVTMEPKVGENGEESAGSPSQGPIFNPRIPPPPFGRPRATRPRVVYVNPNWLNVPYRYPQRPPMPYPMRPYYYGN